jgi:hypothetical protein
MERGALAPLRRAGTFLTLGPLKEPHRCTRRPAASFSPSEFIQSPGDEFDIVVDYVNALRTDPVAVERLGTVQRRAAFGYSASGFRLRGLLRIKQGKGLFDFSIVGGTGNGFSHPAGTSIGFSNAEKPPLPGAGLEIDLQSETDVVVLGAHKTRHEETNFRSYQFAGGAHLRDVDCVESSEPRGATASNPRRRSGSALRTTPRSLVTPTGMRWSPMSAGFR